MTGHVYILSTANSKFSHMVRAFLLVSHSKRVANYVHEVLKTVATKAHLIRTQRESIKIAIIVLKVWGL